MPYRIAWKSKITFKCGFGDPVIDDKNYAENHAKELNRFFPEIDHWVEYV